MSILLPHRFHFLDNFLENWVISQKIIASFTRSKSVRIRIDIGWLLLELAYFSNITPVHNDNNPEFSFSQSSLFCAAQL